MQNDVRVYVDEFHDFSEALDTAAKELAKFSLQVSSAFGWLIAPEQATTTDIEIIDTFSVEPEPALIRPSVPKAPYPRFSRHSYHKPKRILCSQRPWRHQG